jgi:hypothetical protein
MLKVYLFLLPLLDPISGTVRPQLVTSVVSAMISA